MKKRLILRCPNRLKKSHEASNRSHKRSHNRSHSHVKSGEETPNLEISELRNRKKTNPMSKDEEISVVTQENRKILKMCFFWRDIAKKLDFCHLPRNSFRNVCTGI